MIGAIGLKILASLPRPMHSQPPITQNKAGMSFSLCEFRLAGLAPIPVCEMSENGRWVIEARNPNLETGKACDAKHYDV
jgi:hypothetical protein